MKKKYMVTACVLILAVCLCQGIHGRADQEPLYIKAAYIMAGEGMLRLVKEQYKEKPRIALTFDDGPNARYTPGLLDGLKEREVHATFFLMGKNIEGNEELVRRMKEEGHLIGNHTYNHVQLDRLSRENACREVLKTNNIIYEVTGEYPMYLRPPYGAWPKNLELCVSMLPVFWDIDTLDWKSEDVDSVMGIIRNQAHDGAVILMHDGYESSVSAALMAVDFLKKEGYEFVTADKLITD